MLFNEISKRDQTRTFKAEANGMFDIVDITPAKNGGYQVSSSNTGIWPAKSIPYIKSKIFYALSN